MAPIKIVVYTVWLFDFFGIAFLFGFITLCFIFAFTFWIQKLKMNINKRVLEEKDNRMKITTETLNSLKVLKLYSWENEFLQRVLKYLK